MLFCQSWWNEFVFIWKKFSAMILPRSDWELEPLDDEVISCIVQLSFMLAWIHFELQEMSETLDCEMSDMLLLMS